MDNLDLFEQWNYAFDVNEKVKFHPDLLPFCIFETQEEINPKDFKDKVGIVEACDWELHAYAQGSIYYCTVNFDGIIIKTFAGAFIKS